MVKVLAACGNGMGSSMVIKMKVENALRKLNQTDFTVNSCSVGEAKGLADGKIKRIAVISIDLGDFLIWYWIRQVVICFNI